MSEYYHLSDFTQRINGGLLSLLHHYEQMIWSGNQLPGRTTGELTLVLDETVRKSNITKYYTE